MAHWPPAPSNQAQPSPALLQNSPVPHLNSCPTQFLAQLQLYLRSHPKLTPTLSHCSPGNSGLCPVWPPVFNHAKPGLPPDRHQVGGATQLPPGAPPAPRLGSLVWPGGSASLDFWGSLLQQLPARPSLWPLAQASHLPAPLSSLLLLPPASWRAHWLLSGSLHTQFFLRGPREEYGDNVRPAISPKNQRPHPPTTTQAPHTTDWGLQSGLANRGGVIPACPGSRSDATKQQSRTRALMVTAKRAQLLLASIYRAGGSEGGGEGSHSH